MSELSRESDTNFVGETDDEEPAASLWASLRGLFALQDLIPLGYLLILRVLVFFAPEGVARSDSALRINICLVTLIGGCAISRCFPKLPSLLRAGAYRAALAFVVLLNYLMLRDVLPLVRPDSLDETLLRIDLMLFGVEPALWMERFNQRPIVEWFSFFYFSYFWISAIYLLVSLAMIRSDRTKTHFALGSLMVLCFGQLGYLLVPGYGPITYLADQFKGPVNGGFFWQCVWDAVQAGSAMKDIFPSLHTATPTWFTFYAFHQAKTDPRWRVPAWITAFFAGNIIISTVFLRWHYAIDVVAGLVLAVTTAYLVPRLAAWDERRRREAGMLPTWIN